MTTVKALYAAAASITVTISSLATAGARRSAALDNSANLYLDAVTTVVVKTGASGTSATGSWAVYAYASADDGTTYTAGGSTDAAYTLKGDELFLGNIAAIANATTYAGVFNVAKAFGDRMPRNWGIIVVNNGGGTSDTTAGNFITKFQGFNTQIV